MHTRYQKGIIIATAYRIKFKLLRLGEGNVQLTKKQNINTTAATSTSAITVNTTTIFMISTASTPDSITVNTIG